MSYNNNNISSDDNSNSISFTKQSKFKRNSNVLQFFTKTWSRDSHGLFDYESKNVNENELIIDKPCVLTRFNDDIIKVESGVNHKKTGKEICNVEINEKGNQ